MKKALFILFLLAIPVLLLAEEPMREWTSKSGKKAQAAFDADNDTDPAIVPLVKNGKHYKVPFNNLSPADQEYVTQIRSGGRDLDEDFGLEEVTEEQNRGLQVVPSGNRYALLIGVNEYAKPVKSLPYCVSDMELLSECLQKSGMLKENITLVTDNSSAERRPTGDNIRHQIETITSLMEPEDQLIIAFSGHGAMVGDKSYLCPCDADLKDLNSIVSRDWVFEQLEKCQAKQKVFIIDASRNEISFDGGRTMGQVRTLEDPIGADTHGFILIASCDKNQRSWVHPDIQHGVFTYFLAQGLSGAAKDEEGYITIMDLFQYASSKTKMYVFNKFSESQVPTFRQGGEMTDFCLAKVESPDSKFKAGDRQVLKVNGVEFAFRYCPSGTFMMGTPENEDNVDNIAMSFFGYDINTIEKQHQVTLTKGYWMLETEVTVGMFKAFVNETGYKSKGNEAEDVSSNMLVNAMANGEMSSLESAIALGNAMEEASNNPWRNPGFPQDDTHPVTCLSWDDAAAFCEWLSQKTGMKIHLPTEAQWEYACRAGTTGAVAGNLDEMAWYFDLSKMFNQFSNGFDESQAQENALKFANMSKTYPVGQKKPNAWGLFDMYGNVAEWCQDWFGMYPDGNVTDPTGPSVGGERVVRGSGIQGHSIMYRSAFRFPVDPRSRSSSTGFRCAMEQSDK